MRVDRKMLRALELKNKEYEEKISHLSDSLSQTKLNFKIHEIEHELDEYELRLTSRYEGRLYWLSNVYSVIDVFSGKEIKAFTNLDIFDEWFRGYKQGVEDGTIIVELNEEETEKVQENKKKSKSK